MKYPVDILTKGPKEKENLLVELERRGFLWVSGRKPTCCLYLEEPTVSITQEGRLVRNLQTDGTNRVHASDFLGMPGKPYMVYSPQGSTPPKRRYATYSKAAKAARIVAAKYPGQEFMVLKVLPGSVKVENNPVTTDTLENDDD